MSKPVLHTAFIICDEGQRRKVTPGARWPAVDRWAVPRSDYAQRLVIAPDEHYVERAFNPAKYGESSPEPVLEITFPSFRDYSLAPEGKHVMSAVVQYAPYELERRLDRGSKQEFEAAAIQVDNRALCTGHHAENYGQRVSCLTPADIEREFHITGGHWHHGELDTRPVPVCTAGSAAPRNTDAH